ncbi:MAG: lectin-like domain-containing protein, partial [Ferruginibacter sp.]
MIKYISIFLLLLFCLNTQAQYTVNGNAVQISCNCYVLTNDVFNQSGSVWNNNKIDLSRSFNFAFNVNLGCNAVEAEGADGIVFVLQPISTSIGTAGGGLGYQNVSPAVGVTIDTWQNINDNDPLFDHISIQLNGDLNHSGAANIAGPVTALATSDNIEDCQWHVLNLIWDAAQKRLSVLMDGTLRVTVVNDFVNTTFGGNPLVFWGFTGSTGGAKNLQQFCTALNPAFKSIAGQKRCVGSPIQFVDSTVSFTQLQKLYWDFGDGSPIDSINTNPIHIYNTGGNFTVKQKVIGADGCVQENNQTIFIGSKPRAGFRFNNACADSLVQFTDTSAVTFGTINNWSWNLNFGATPTVQNPSQSYPVYAGINAIPIKLAVKTIEGCESDTTTQFLTIFSRPNASFTSTGFCQSTPIAFTNTSNFTQPGFAPNGNINQWNWNFGGGITSTLQNPSPVFSNPGNQNITLTVTSSNGCKSLPYQSSLTIKPKPIAGFRNEPVCLNIPITYTDTSTITGG